MRNFCEVLFLFRNSKKVVNKAILPFLLYQVYSSLIIRKAYQEWDRIPEHFKENTPLEIQELIRQSSNFSNEELNEKLNQITIKNAISVLKEYQNCDVPFAENQHVEQKRMKLTSQKGDNILSLLENYYKQGIFSDRIALLALRASHKFLFDERYYLKVNITSSIARTLAIKGYMGKQKVYIFPKIQLTKGCLHQCSHCDSRAEPYLSHMPWPVFRMLYERLNRFYKHYPQKEVGCHFANFFADSDMLTYYDPVMKVDSGDVGLWISSQKGKCQYMSKGITSPRSKLALSKAILSRQPITISFVDTPKENMPRNIKRLNDTLDVIEAVEKRHKTNTQIAHLHLKSGPYVDEGIFRGFVVEKTPIYAMGKAKDFPFEELEHYTDSDFTGSMVIEPNGNVVFQRIENLEIISEVLNNIYCKNSSKKAKKMGLIGKLFDRMR